MAIYTTTAALCALNLALGYGWHASLRKEEAAMAADREWGCGGRGAKPPTKKVKKYAQAQLRKHVG